MSHLFLPVDKYQPAEVLKADVELVAPADLPPVRSVDVVCRRRGQAASAPRRWDPHPTPTLPPAPLEGGIAIGVRPGEEKKTSFCGCTKGKKASDLPEI